jgi:hypothetical protein
MPKTILASRTPRKLPAGNNTLTSTQPKPDDTNLHQWSVPYCHNVKECDVIKKLALYQRDHVLDFKTAASKRICWKSYTSINFQLLNLPSLKEFDDKV